MPQLSVSIRKPLLWLPLAGCLTFVILYVFAAFAYPGGNQYDAHAKGFSWIHNYWCNLLNETAINGEHNEARPIALSAMIVLIITLAVFWIRFPGTLRRIGFIAWSVRIAGPLALLTSIFILGPDHDMVINIACCLGLIALMGTFIILYQAQLKRLFRMGMVIVVLIGLNNLCYYSEGGMPYLPVVQKISFLYFILWICLVQIRLIKFKQAL